MRLSRRSCRISSALRKQANGRKRRAQQRASTQVDVTSEPAGSYVQRKHTGVYLQVIAVQVYLHAYITQSEEYLLIGVKLPGSLILPAGDGQLVPDVKHPA